MGMPDMVIVFDFFSEEESGIRVRFGAWGGGVV